MRPSEVARINTTRVLQRIWLSDGIGRASLARELGLVKSTVTRIVTMLLDRNLVCETEESVPQPGVGRRPLHLTINEKYGYILGLEIQTERFNAVAINLRGDVIFSKEGGISPAGKDLVGTFLEIVTSLESPLGHLRLPLIGIGVGLAGIIDQSAGVIVESNPLNIAEPVDFVRAVEEEIGVPVVIGNDANCCCWGELAFRKTSRHNNFLFVFGEFRAGVLLHGDPVDGGYWGPAIGFGLVLDGQMYHGSSHSAGEFKSVLWKPGSSGQLSISDVDAKRIKEDGTIMRRAFSEICAHVAFLVNTLNLSNVVFGGEIAEFKDLLVPMLDAAIQKNWVYQKPVKCSVEFSSLRQNAVAYGAGGMFLESIFSIPQIRYGDRTTAETAGSTILA